ncbi:hypothetical protein D3C80_2045840 [compost metagenome]
MRHAPISYQLFGCSFKGGLVCDTCLINADTIFKSRKLFSNLLLREWATAEDCHLRACFGQRLGKLRSKLPKSACHNRNAVFDAKNISHC